MADDSLDGGEFAAQRALHLIDPFMYVLHGEHRVDAAMEIDDLALRGLAHPHIVNLPDEGDVPREGAEGLASPRNAGIRRIASGKPAHLQRLDVRLDLDLGAELLAERCLPAGRDVVSRRECQTSVDLQAE